MGLSPFLFPSTGTANRLSKELLVSSKQPSWPQKATTKKQYPLSAYFKIVCIGPGKIHLWLQEKCHQWAHMQMLRTISDPKAD